MTKISLGEAKREIQRAVHNAKEAGEDRMLKLVEVLSKAFKVGMSTYPADTGAPLHDALEENGHHSFEEAGRQAMQASREAYGVSRGAQMGGSGSQASEHAKNAMEGWSHERIARSHRVAAMAHEKLARSHPNALHRAAQAHAAKVHHEAADMHETVGAIGVHRRGVGLKAFKVGMSTYPGDIGHTLHDALDEAGHHPYEEAKRQAEAASEKLYRSKAYEGVSRLFLMREHSEMAKIHDRMSREVGGLRKEHAKLAEEHREAAAMHETAEAIREHMERHKAFKVGMTHYPSDIGAPLHDELEEHGKHSYKEAARQSYEATQKAHEKTAQANIAYHNRNTAYEHSNYAMLGADPWQGSPIDHEEVAREHQNAALAHSAHGHDEAEAAHMEAARMHLTTHAIQKHREQHNLKDLDHKWISKKIRRIQREGIRGKKVSHEQAVAVAINMAKERKAMPEDEGFGEMYQSGMGWIHPDKTVTPVSQRFGHMAALKTHKDFADRTTETPRDNDLLMRDAIRGGHVHITSAGNTLHVQGLPDQVKRHRKLIKELAGKKHIMIHEPLPMWTREAKSAKDMVESGPGDSDASRLIYADALDEMDRPAEAAMHRVIASPTKEHREAFKLYANPRQATDNAIQATHNAMHASSATGERAHEAASNMADRVSGPRMLFDNHRKAFEMHSNLAKRHDRMAERHESAASGSRERAARHFTAEDHHLEAAELHRRAAAHHLATDPSIEVKSFDHEPSEFAFTLSSRTSKIPDSAHSAMSALEAGNSPKEHHTDAARDHMRLADGARGNDKLLHEQAARAHEEAASYYNKGRWQSFTSASGENRKQVHAAAEAAGFEQEGRHYNQLSWEHPGGELEMKLHLGNQIVGHANHRHQLYSHYKGRVHESKFDEASELGQHMEAHVKHHGLEHEHQESDHSPNEMLPEDFYKADVSWIHPDGTKSLDLSALPEFANDPDAEKHAKEQGHLCITAHPDALVVAGPLGMFRKHRTYIEALSQERPVVYAKAFAEERHAFHMQMHDPIVHPEADQGIHQIYADWVEDRGHPEIAHIIRNGEFHVSGWKSDAPEGAFQLQTGHHYDRALKPAHRHLILSENRSGPGQMSHVWKMPNDHTTEEGKAHGRKVAEEVINGGGYVGLETRKSLGMETEVKSMRDPLEEMDEHAKEHGFKAWDSGNWEWQNGNLKMDLNHQHARSDYDPDYFILDSYHGENSHSTVFHNIHDLGEHMLAHVKHHGLEHEPETSGYRPDEITPEDYYKAELRRHDQAAKAAYEATRAVYLGYIQHPETSQRGPFGSAHKTAATLKAIRSGNHEGAREFHEREARRHLRIRDPHHQELARLHQHAADAHTNALETNVSKARMIVDAAIQQKAHENEHALADRVKGASFLHSAPLDVAIGPPEWHSQSVAHREAKARGERSKMPEYKGKASHGIEVKTLFTRSKLNLSPSARQAKLKWAKQNGGATLHTVAFHGDKIYYRRGVGAYRTNKMHVAKDLAEVHSLIHMKHKDLPTLAKEEQKRVNVHQS